MSASPAVAEPAGGALLVADGVQRRFGGLMAVDVEHFEVESGRITALIGPNGAGKTTFFNLLSGFDRADAGSWMFDGRQMKGLRAHQIARLGMVRTFQLTKALAKLSVLDNMQLAAPDQSGERIVTALFHSRWQAQEQNVHERAVDLLRRFGLLEKANDYGGTLSGGQRKLLEMARALMCRPKMILLDEPVAGVNPALVESILEHVKELRADGLTVLFVEHDMDVVMGISDHVVCMALGRVIASGTPAAVAADPAVVDAYLGARHGD